MTTAEQPATVRRWSANQDSHACLEVVLDDGRVLTLDPGVTIEGFRSLRTGQRIRLRMDGDTVVAVTWPVD